MALSEGPLITPKSKFEVIKIKKELLGIILMIEPIKISNIAK